MAGDPISIEATAYIVPLKIEDAQYGIAAKVLSEPLGHGLVVERIDEERHKLLSGSGYSGVTQRTAGEILTTGSAGVFSKLDPE